MKETADRMLTRRHIKQARLVGYSTSSLLAFRFVKTKCHRSNCNHENTCFSLKTLFCGQPWSGWITYNRFVSGWQANKSKVVHLSDWRCMHRSLSYSYLQWHTKVWHYRSWGGHVMAQTWQSLAWPAASETSVLFWQRKCAAKAP